MNDVALFRASHHMRCGARELLAGVARAFVGVKNDEVSRGPDALVYRVHEARAQWKVVILNENL
jgi:hypothetical protein